MKIEPVNFYNNFSNKKTYLKRTQNRLQSNTLPFVYPAGYAKINFRGKSMDKLWQEYDWYINNDKTPAIFSFLKIKETPEAMDKFLTAILETEDRSKELLSSIVYNPRKSKEITEKLYKILPTDSKNLLPFCMTVLTIGHIIGLLNRV